MTPLFSRADIPGINARGHAFCTMLSGSKCNCPAGFQSADRHKEPPGQSHAQAQRNGSVIMSTFNFVGVSYVTALGALALIVSIL
jgi:hypothetical protein